MSDSDLQQVNRVAADAEAANAANGLTSALLLPVDNKGQTADANGPLRSPVNKSIRALAAMLAGIRGALFGNITGINVRTLKSLSVDGTGGAVSAAGAGNVTATGAVAAGGSVVAGTTISAALVRGGTTIPQTANPQGTTTKDSPVFGFGSFSWSGSAYSLTGGFNVFSITPIATGIVDITFASAPANYLNTAATANGSFNGGAAFTIDATATGIVSGRLVVRYSLRNAAAALTDAGFSTHVFCGG